MEYLAQHIEGLIFTSEHPLTIKEIVSKGGHKDWKEVVCQIDVTKRFYRNIQIALIESGFGDGIIPDGKISRDTKEALLAYQLSNELPIGSLDVETLNHLGVDF